MTDIIQEVLKWMNGIGDKNNPNGQTEINYGNEPYSMNGIKFNSEPQVSRLHPVVYGELNTPRDGIKFNS